LSGGVFGPSSGRVFVQVRRVGEHAVGDKVVVIDNAPVKVEERKVADAFAGLDRPESLWRL
jgi:hypothetical protein